MFSPVLVIYSTSVPETKLPAVNMTINGEVSRPHDQECITHIQGSFHQEEGTGPNHAFGGFGAVKCPSEIIKCNSCGGSYSSTQTGCPNCRG